MGDNVMKAFMDATGCDTRTAYLALQKDNWDLVAAFDKFSSRAKAKEAKKQLHENAEIGDNEDVSCHVLDTMSFDMNFLQMNYSCDETKVVKNNFYLPNLDEFPTKFKNFIFNDLIDLNVLKTLENSSSLNWWCAPFQIENRLWSLITMGDGNCLLHAASMSISGVHDRFLLLRDALYNFISQDNPITASIKRRWRWHESQINLAIDVVRTEDEWEKEWLDVVNSASSQKLSGNSTGCYRGLESIHILCLAHVLKRVIIVMAETMAKDIQDQPLTPIYFGGIYIPLEVDAAHCEKNPLLLVYNSSHFSALVLMQNESVPEYYIPVTDKEGNCLPMRFSVDPGVEFVWWKFPEVQNDYEESVHDSALSVLNRYLNIIDYSDIPFCSGPGQQSTEEYQHDEYTRNNVPNQLQCLIKHFQIPTEFPQRDENTGKPKFPLKMCAKIRLNKNMYQREVISNYLTYAKKQFAEKTRAASSSEVLMECVNACGRFGSESTSYLCSSCFQTQKEQLHLIEDNAACFATGKSKFYTSPGLADYAATKNLPKPITVQSNNTLYLSNSTFFNDSNKPFNSSDTDANKNQLHIVEIGESSQQNLAQTSKELHNNNCDTEGSVQNMNLSTTTHFGPSKETELRENPLNEFCIDLSSTKLPQQVEVQNDNCDMEGSVKNMNTNEAMHIASSKETESSEHPLNEFCFEVLPSTNRKEQEEVQNGNCPMEGSFEDMNPDTAMLGSFKGPELRENPLNEFCFEVRPSTECTQEEVANNCDIEGSAANLNLGTGTHIG